MLEEKKKTFEFKGEGLAASTKYRDLKGISRGICGLLTLAALVAIVINAFHLTVFGFSFVMMGYLTFMIAVVLPQTFLLIRPGRGPVRDQLPWYDVTGAVVSFGIYFYIFVNQMELSYGVWAYLAPWHARIMALVAIVLLIEAVRRTTGLIIAAVCVFFAFYPLFAPMMPYPFSGIKYPLWQTVSYHVFGDSSILGPSLRIVASTMLGFFLFAAVLLSTGADRFFFNFAMGILGHARGGPAKVAVVASALFGTISGAVAANVLSTGSVTIPTMKRVGYPPHYAAAVESCASTGGVIMPPIMGAVAFLMAEFLAVSYAEVIVAASIPSVLYYLCLFIQTDAYAGKNRLVGLPRDALPSAKHAFLESGWYICISVALLLYLVLVVGIENQAPLISCVALVLFPMLRKRTRLGVKNATEFMHRISVMFAEILPVISAVGLIFGAMMITGIAASMSFALIRMAGGNVILMLLSGAVISFILGMGIGQAAIYIILAVFLCPALIKFGINPMAAHLFVLYYAMVSFITPPVAVATMVAAPLAGASVMKTGITASRLGIAMYLVPFLFALEPGMILQNPSFMRTVFPLGTAVIGIAFISWASEGWAIRLGRLPLWTRPLLFAGGVLLAWPDVLPSIVGAVLVVLVLAYFGFRKMLENRKKWLASI